MTDQHCSVPLVLLSCFLCSLPCDDPHLHDQYADTLDARVDVIILGLHAMRILLGFSRRSCWDSQQHSGAQAHEIRHSANGTSIVRPFRAGLVCSMLTCHYQLVYANSVESTCFCTAPRCGSCTCDPSIHYGRSGVSSPPLREPDFIFRAQQRF